MPSLERLFVLFAHAFAVVLVYYSVKENRLWLLAIAFIYKSLIDGMLLPIEYYSGSVSLWVIEGYVALLGILGLVGLWWLKKAYGKDVVTLSAISIPAE
jgi:hypothetical protein